MEASNEMNVTVRGMDENIKINMYVLKLKIKTPLKY